MRMKAEIENTERKLCDDYLWDHTPSIRISELEFLSFYSLLWEISPSQFGKILPPPKEKNKHNTTNEKI